MKTSVLITMSFNDTERPGDFYLRAFVLALKVMKLAV